MNTVQDKYAPGDQVMVHIDALTEPPVQGTFKQDLCFGRILAEVPHFIYKNVIVVKGKRKYNEFTKEQKGYRDGEFVWWKGKWQLSAYRRDK